MLLPHIGTVTLGRQFDIQGPLGLATALRRPQAAGMVACGCFSPIDIATTLAGYGLLGLAGLFLGLVCLIALLLGATALVAHLIQRWRTDGDDEADGGGYGYGYGGPVQDADGDEEPTGLAAFTWRE
ncbi:hypothetical protein ACX6XY_07200 [Streptomyces sp. O3]